MGREDEPERGERPNQVRRSPEKIYEEAWNARSGARTHALTPEMLESGDPDQEPGGYFSNIAETLDPTFQRVSSRASGEDDGEEDGDRAGGGKSAPIVPPVKRKTSRDKNRKVRGK